MMVLSFRSIYSTKKLSFPCDPSGKVMMEKLTPRAAENLKLAQKLLGREYLCPVIEHMDEDIN